MVFFQMAEIGILKNCWWLIFRSIQIPRNLSYFFHFDFTLNQRSTRIRIRIKCRLTFSIEKIIIIRYKWVYDWVLSYFTRFDTCHMELNILFYRFYQKYSENKRMKSFFIHLYNLRFWYFNMVSWKAVVCCFHRSYLMRRVLHIFNFCVLCLYV